MFLPDDVVGGMAKYRMILAKSFYYKFINYAQNIFIDNNLKRTNITTSNIDYSNAKCIINNDNIKIKATEKYKVIGKEIPHLSGMLHTTGEAKYLDDIIVESNCLYAALVLSKKPHAIIKNIDLKNAINHIGVYDIVTYENIKNKFNNIIGTGSE